MTVNIDNAYYNKITDKKRQAVLVRSNIERLTSQFFFDKGFIFVEPPILHEAIANKKSEIYLPMYNGMYSLSSSNALFMGMYASEFNKVFTISRCFRDECETLNHLIEFDILEAEILNCNMDEMIQLIQSYVKFILDQLLDSLDRKSFYLLLARIRKLKDEFNPCVMTYDEFVSNLYGNDYDKSLNVSNVDYLVMEHLKEIVILVDYPTKYATWTSKSKGNGTNITMNLLLPESYGELCEGCERTNDIGLLQNKIHIAKAEPIQWYVDSVRKIHAERCGFGLGIDRLVKWIIGSEKIEDTRFFPRVKLED